MCELVKLNSFYTCTIDRLNHSQRFSIISDASLHQVNSLIVPEVSKKYVHGLWEKFGCKNFL